LRLEPERLPPLERLEEEVVRLELRLFLPPPRLSFLVLVDEERLLLPLFFLEDPEEEREDFFELVGINFA